MMQSNYGYRYPGGHSVIDTGFVPDDSIVHSKTSGKTKKQKQREAQARLADAQFKARRHPSEPVYPKRKGTITCEYKNLKKGARVRHKELGMGTVKGCSPDNAYVLFDDRNGTYAFSRKQAVRKLTVVRPPKARFDAARSASAKSLPADVSKKIKEKHSKLVGCQVVDDQGRAGVVLRIGGGKVVVRLLRQEKDVDYSYPFAFSSGSLSVSRKVDHEIIEDRQKKAFEMFQANFCH